MDPAALQKSRAETRAAFENRALMYAAIYEELAEEIGPERATRVLKRAIHKRGLDVGLKYRAAASAGDLDEVGRIFVEGSPVGGALFSPAIEDRTEDAIVLRMMSCPLVDAWRAQGMDEAEIDRLCEIAAAVDEGTFEGAGLELTFLDRIGRAGSKQCLLKLELPDEK
jgi:hypothetical protein